MTDLLPLLQEFYRDELTALLRHQVAVLPGNGLDASGHSAEYLRLHFLASPDELTEAVRRLAAAWRAYRPPAFPVPAPAALTV